MRRPSSMLPARQGSQSAVQAARSRRLGGMAGGLFLATVCATARITAAGEAQPTPRSTAPAAVTDGDRVGFRLLPPDLTGIDFRNFLPESRHLTNGILLNGAGVAAGDVDGDGWCDLYFCRSQGANVLYRNLGNWRFADITASAGVGCGNLTSTAAVLADLDGDGDLDLVVNTVGNGTRVFLNDGKGSFQPAAYSLNPGVAGMSLALADVDGDGFLDVYLANHRTSALMDLPSARFTFRTVDGRTEVHTVNGRPVTDPDLADRFVYSAQAGIWELGESDLLLRNLGGTNFEAMGFTGGRFLDEEGKPLTRPLRGWALTAAFHDLNGDGLPDLYVCHDFQSEDVCWINQGHGTFRRLSSLAQRKIPFSSMAVDFADVNRDGQVDFLTLDMMSRSHRERMLFLKGPPPEVHTPGLIRNRPQYELNTLFLNRGDTTFAEIGQYSGLEAAEWAWSCAFLDVDLDGWEDVLVVNGMERAGRDQDVAEQIKKLRAARSLSDAEVYQARRMFPRQATANLAFRNRHDLTFDEVGGRWGFDVKGVSSSIALADLDNDGDLDAVINNLNERASILRNETMAPRVAVRLAGRPPNTRGIGARIRVLGGPVPVQSQEMISGGRYLAGDDSIRCFAAGSLTNRLTIEVLWRSGRKTVVESAEPNRVHLVREPEPAGVESAPEPGPTTQRDVWFEDVSDRLAHTHFQEVSDDFARQPLLPNRLSQLGPGVAWCDLDADGHEDLVVGAGAGGQLSVFKGDGRGGFSRWTNTWSGPVLTQDTGGIVGWRDPSGRPILLVGLANYVMGPGQGTALGQLAEGAASFEPLIGAADASSGPVALGDVQGDGPLELFVGGRVVGGRYPEPASSLLLQWNAGKWSVDVSRSESLKAVGLVSGAVFSDLDGDGKSELVLACEWGPIRVFKEQAGRLVEETARLGLTNHLGWWNGVAAGDFDGDGRLDLVASNWGANTKYQAHRERPLELYYGDFTGLGTVDLIEAHWEPQLQKVVPERQMNPLAAALPWVRERFASHRSYSAAGVAEVLGPRLAQARVLAANWLESTVFLNRGDHFEAHALPAEAQWAPAFGIGVGDFNGDGNEDVFLAQNFFDAQPETPRYDAGRGLWLAGDGAGGFRAVDGSLTGVEAYGEQRAAALADFDEDGRVDLVLTQNGGATKLYRNRLAPPGIRVRLQGGQANPHGIGAGVALRFGERRGPVRELHAGGGYWSQDSSTVVLGARERPTGVWIRWPGGQVTQTPLPEGKQEIVVAAP